MPMHKVSYRLEHNSSTHGPVGIEYILIAMYEDKHLSNVKERVLLSNDLFKQLHEFAERFLSSDSRLVTIPIPSIYCPILLRASVLSAIVLWLFELLKH